MYLAHSSVHRLTRVMQIIQFIPINPICLSQSYQVQAGLLLMEIDLNRIVSTFHYLLCVFTGSSTLTYGVSYGTSA